MTKDIITANDGAFDYSILSEDQHRTVKLFENDIEDILMGSSYRIGKILIKAKDYLGHGLYGEWIKARFGWSDRTARRMVDIATNFTKSDTESVLVSKGAQNELSPNSVPESAREEMRELVKSGQKITKKVAKKLVEKHKELVVLKAKYAKLEADGTVKEIKPNLNNLIPGIKAVYDMGGIMEARALKISTMQPEGQQQWLSIYTDNLSLENQLNEKTAKVVELESRPEPEPKIIEKEVIPLDVQTDLEKAKTALDKLKKAEAAAKKAREDFNELAEKKHAMGYEIQQLKDQLKVNDPANIDAAHAESFKDILELLGNRLIRFEEDRKVSDHPMNKTWDILNKTMDALSQFCGRTENMVCINSIGE